MSTYRFATHTADGRVCCSTKGDLATLHRCERCRTLPASAAGKSNAQHPTSCTCVKCASKHLTFAEKMAQVLDVGRMAAAAAAAAAPVPAPAPPRVTFAQQNARVQTTAKAEVGVLSDVTRKAVRLATQGTPSIEVQNALIREASHARR